MKLNNCSYYYLSSILCFGIESCFSQLRPIFFGSQSGLKAIKTQSGLIIKFQKWDAKIIQTNSMVYIASC
jgi:hypothetical protein